MNGSELSMKRAFNVPFQKIAAVLLALMMLVGTSPALAAGVEYVPKWTEYEKTLPADTQITWNVVSDAMDILFDAAETEFQNGDMDAAWTAINQAYYGYYEITGFERNAMSYIAGSRKTEVENMFSLCKSICKHGGTVEEFNEATETLRDAIHTDANKLDGVEEEASDTGMDLSQAGSFAGAFGILLREGIEAMLVLGGIIAYLVKAGQRKSLRQVYVGAVLGVVCSGVLAFFLYSIGLGDGSEEQEIIEGCTALVAVVMLFWVSNWMLSKTSTEAWNAYIKKTVAAGAAAAGGTFALAFTAWLAVFREGGEVVLFLYPLVTTTDPIYVWAGIIAGFVALAIIFIIMRVFSVKLPLTPFFMVMSAIMFVMCVSFLGSGLNELIEGNVLVGTHIAWIPNGNDILTLFGINPWLETIIPQVLLLAVTAFIYIRHFYLESKTKENGEEKIDPTKQNVEALEAARATKAVAEDAKETAATADAPEAAADAPEATPAEAEEATSTKA